MEKENIVHTAQRVALMAVEGELIGRLSVAEAHEVLRRVREVLKLSV